MTELLDRPNLSALTLGRGRADHLRLLIGGLAAQDHRPCELIVGVMQDGHYEDLPDAPFPIRQIKVPGRELPLARARNTVAQAAAGSVLAFVDIDCIPAPGWAADYARLCQSGGGVLMGEVAYLPKDATGQGLDYATFARLGKRHEDRQEPPASGLKQASDYRVFWSLNFALHRNDWDLSGGFDTAFIGYGGEDTDFGRTLFERGIAINWMRGAKVYHQFHDHCMPPIHHMPAILRNTEIFAAKWGHRTMEHWLRAFRLMGLIDEGPDGLYICREPDRDDYALCRQDADMPYAATTRVLKFLETRASDRSSDMAAE